MYTPVMIITISGTPGSGKSTVGRLLAKKLKYRYYSIGAMRRAMAQERGLTLQEFNVLGEKEGFTDQNVDLWQKKLGLENDNVVVEGRTSFHFIPHSVKIFLAADLSEAARRIFHDPDHVRRFEASHHYKSPKELEHGLRGRIASDTRRYKKYYKLNIFLPKHYDVNLDTTKSTPTQTLIQIMNKLAKISKNNGKVDKVGIKHVQVLRKKAKKTISRKIKNVAKIRQKNGKRR